MSLLTLLPLMRLQAGRAIVDPKTGQPTSDFMRFLNDMIANQNAINRNIVNQVNDITTALENSGIAIRTANEALAAAAANKREQALVSSYVTPSNVLTSAISTTDATTAIITIANHTRHYGDGTSVAVTGGSISGVPLSAYRYVYYMDPTRAGGAVSYQLASAQVDATQGMNRHTVGAIQTPDPGATGGTGGSSGGGPGIPRTGNNPIP